MNSVLAVLGRDSLSVKMCCFEGLPIESLEEEMRRQMSALGKHRDYWSQCGAGGLVSAGRDLFGSAESRSDVHATLVI